MRRRFGLEDPDGICRVQRHGESAFVGLPEREALKIQDLWSRGEIGLELSVEVRAPVVVGIYPMRIARYITNGGGHYQPAINGSGSSAGANGQGPVATNGDEPPMPNGLGPPRVTELGPARQRPDGRGPS